jgi:transcription antitermination factor NusG
MPILSSEPCVYPDELFLAESQDSTQQWWVLHTKPRQEKALARALHAQEISFFLPLFTKKTRIRTRDVPSHSPLFPGYVFLHANREGLLLALATRRVARHLEVPNQEQLWDDLRQIDRLIQTGQNITPEAVLETGTLVEIAAGPLMGLRGEVIKTASGNRFVVKVNFIQHGASVLLDGEVLEPVQR